MFLHVLTQDQMFFVTSVSRSVSLIVVVVDKTRDLNG